MVATPDARVWSLVSPQACAGGEEESEEGGGGTTAATLLEALRQFRIHHRGQYHSVLEETLASYRLRDEGAAATTTTTADEDRQEEDNKRTSRDSHDDDDQPASPPSPPSPPPSPATLELEAGSDETKPCPDWEAPQHALYAPPVKPSPQICFW